MPKIKSTEKTVEQLEEDLRKTREELAIQEWGIEKTLWGMKVLVKELIQRNKEIEEAKAKNAALLESIGDGVVATDQSGKVIFINKVAKDTLGLTNLDIIGKSFIHEVSQEDAQGNKIPDKLRPITLVLNSGKTTINITYSFVRKDGIKIPVAITVAPVIIDSNTVGAILVFRDITKEKEIDTAKTEFVSLASHQLRTPLTTISWYTEMILKGDVGQVIPDQKKYLEEIYTGNHRMIELVNTLLDVSRLELGTFKVEPKPTDVIALAQSVLDEQEPRILKKKLVITKDFSKDIPTFSTDPKLLRMVFQNLLANAVEYTPEGGRIEIGISLDKEKQILIKVSDTGYGIPKNQQDKIFTKFFRADNVRDKDTDGTGLGLYIVKSIVENAGGKIWFESPGGSALGGESPSSAKPARPAGGATAGKEENPGTTFYVALPLDGVNPVRSKTPHA